MTEAFAMLPSYHTGPWTIDEVLALPEDGMRYELVEGRLVVSPVPANAHQMAGKRLERLFDNALPADLEAMREVNLRIGVDLLIPDVMVATSAVLTGPGQFVVPADVVVVTEILSPGNSKFERAWKPQRYAEGGIPFYTEVDLIDGPRITVHELRDREYFPVADARAGDLLRLHTPFELSFDPADLVGAKR